MRILKKKNITEAKEEENKLVPPEVELEPVVDHTTANTLASKEANEEAAEKNIEASGNDKIAQEVVDDIQDPKKDTPAPKTPSLKPYTEAKQVADRKALSALIKECNEAGRKYKIRRSLEEGYRYVFEDFEYDYPECYFVCHSDEDANNENGYFDTEEEAKAYAEANPDICCIFKVCGNEEEKIWERLPECNKQPVTEEAEPEVQPVDEEPKLETFDEQMDFLAKDEQEAIDGYHKVLELVQDEHVKEQLNKILVEEEAHKAFLEAVKGDPSLEYSHEEHEDEEEKEPEIVATETEVVAEGEEEHHVCPKCGKEICECDKQEPVNEEVTTTNESEPVTEAIVDPVSEPGDNVEVIDEVPAVVVDQPELVVEPNPDEEIEIDSIETFEPTDEKAKSTMTTIKDAGDGAMWAFKDTLKDLYNLKIKVSDLQQLLSNSSDWLLDLLGFNGNGDEEVVVAPEEIPEPIEEPAPVADEEPAPVVDYEKVNINDFDDVEPIDYEEEEDEQFFVGD